jgi:tetratricopeptide (TPR) repeat protein
VASEDLGKARKQLDGLIKENQVKVANVETTARKKQQNYEARILSLEAQLAKAKERINADADRYHYNLGVLYTQNKDYDSAIGEFKMALGFNPKDAQAHYNLGIIYDDFYKDKENAKYHYRNYLELAPASDDADAVKEWLADMSK